MLEILVNLNRGQDGQIDSGTSPKSKAGDIIVAKKQPCVWGEEEKRIFLITYLKDDELESSMDGEIISSPYAIYDEVDMGNGKVEKDLMNPSKYRVDLAMFEGSAGLDPTNTTQEPVTPNGKDYLEISDLILDDNFRI